MNVKKLSFMLMILVPLALTSISCKMVSSRGNSRAGGDGRTPATAIVITPTTVQQQSRALLITTNDQNRWFYARLNSGKSYCFETAGEGDPLMRVYREAQVKSGDQITGDPVIQDDDGGSGTNSKITFRPSGSGGYYIMINLYAGRRWSGNLKYKSSL